MLQDPVDDASKRPPQASFLESIVPFLEPETAVTVMERANQLPWEEGKKLGLKHLSMLFACNDGGDDATYTAQLTSEAVTCPVCNRGLVDYNDIMTHTCHTTDEHENGRENEY
jgi:hypothetical protein